MVATLDSSPFFRGFSDILAATMGKHHKVENHKIAVIFFGVCTGFALWMIFDFQADEILPETEPIMATDFPELEGIDDTSYNYATAKKILFYTTRYNQLDWGIGLGNEPFKGQMCRVQNCFFTANKSLVAIDDFDALLFHIGAINEEVIHGLPQLRKPHQRYIFATSAPAKNGMFSFHESLKDLFNWTMTYDYRSTFPNPTARILSADPDKISLQTKNLLGYVHNTWTRRPDPNFLKSERSDLVAWYLDDCNEKRTHREDYVSFMENYIKVDIYGRCGTLQCTPAQGESCITYLAKKYKFLLAFEDDLCTDYTSFKWFSVMQEETTVAVVMGGANYAALAPPMSYINVADFKSAKELTNYLLYLHANPEEYMKYFAWKYEWRVDYRCPICGLCEMLNSAASPQSTISLDTVAQQAECKEGKEMPYIISSLADEIEDRNREEEEIISKAEKLTEMRIEEKSQSHM